jgi:hypothetical protein
VSAEAPVGRRLGPVTIPPNIGPLMLLLVSAIGIGAVVWGAFFANPDIHVQLFDAGPEEELLTSLRAYPVAAFPEQNLYVVGLDDGRLRAVDGRVEASGCNVVYEPDDPRGGARNPFGNPGVLEDPCSGAVWSVAGDAIAGSDEPLRTPQISFNEDAGGVRHLFVEVISIGED